MIAVKFLMNSGIAKEGHVNPLMINAGDAMTIKICVAFKASGIKILTKTPKLVEAMTNAAVRRKKFPTFSGAGILK